MPKTLNSNCPFTLKEYRSLVKLAKAKHRIIDYNQYKEYDKYIIWRHDVEYSIEEMNKLARIDYEEEIQSILFLQTHSEFYNIWERETIKKVNQWIEWGHAIGLHFDCGFYSVDELSNIEKIISYEKDYLNRIFNQSIDCFAYHNPNKEILEYNENYSGLINAYNKDLFDNDEVKYVSDSNGRWREYTVRDVLMMEDANKIVVNTHDTWWNDLRIPQFDKFKNAINNNAKLIIDNYVKYSNIVVKDII